MKIKKGTLVVTLQEFAGPCIVTGEADVSAIYPNAPKDSWFSVNNGFGGTNVTVPVEEIIPLVQTDGTITHYEEFKEVLQKHLPEAFFVLARRLLKLEKRMRELEKQSRA